MRFPAAAFGASRAVPSRRNAKTAAPKASRRGLTLTNARAHDPDMGVWRLGLCGLALTALACSSSGSGGGSGGSAGSGGGSGAASGGSGASSGSGGSGATGTGATSGSGGGAGTTGNVCELPKDVGPCDGAIPRWWFNAQSGKCEGFSYGGCEGNGNNFESADECVKQCAATAAAPCDVISCDGGATCVYTGTTPLCLQPCTGTGTCPGGLTCGCASSCPGCKDCVQVCLPS